MLLGPPDKRPRRVTGLGVREHPVVVAGGERSSHRVGQVADASPRWKGEADLGSARSRPPMVLGVPSATDAPVDHDHEPVGEVLGFVHEMGGEEDGDAEGPKARDHVPRHAPCGRVEPRGGLVEEDEFGIADSALGRRQDAGAPPESLLAAVSCPVSPSRPAPTSRGRHAAPDNSPA